MAQSWAEPEENYPYRKWPALPNEFITFSNASSKEQREAENRLIDLQNDVFDELTDIGAILG